MRPHHQLGLGHAEDVAVQGQGGLEVVGGDDEAQLADPGGGDIRDLPVVAVGRIVGARGEPREPLSG